ncbi:M4 family metallopeptidase [Bacillus thuringiensis]|uniref:M4 family metallopeptidase n=1 Tax=Bacillus thuringiensis TaxID=1428 RepID=UPI000BFBF72E|nr:M4 family metallopeptidase [Bacillus thuringiensis]PGW73696.1 bacillolysin [Bacillus thuringiensis]
MKKRTGFAAVLAVSSLISTLSSPITTSAEESVNILSARKMDEKLGVTEFISGNLTSPSTESYRDIVFSYINKQKYNLGSETAENSFNITKVENDSLGTTVVRLQQIFKGVPIWGSTQVAHINKEGVLNVFSGSFVPNIPQNLKNQEQRLSSEEAVSIALNNAFLQSNPNVKHQASLVIYAKEDIVRYAYNIHLSTFNPKPENHDFFIDATDGTVLNHVELLRGLQEAKGIKGEIRKGTGNDSFGFKQRLNLIEENGIKYLVDKTRGQGIYTYDAQNLGDDEDETLLPGILFNSIDGKFVNQKDQAAVDAHVYAGKVYDYYKKVHGRDSYDGKGAKLVSSVHFGKNYENAFWSPEQGQMVYGDGNGTTRAYSAAVDVVGHELTHAVIENTSNLIYENESGALNESISDIFGTLIEFYNGKNPNYTVGENLYFESGRAIRSMSDPTTLGDPDHYSKRYTGNHQSLLVHTNSSIVNKAAYLIAEGGTHYGIKVKGIGKDKMGKIFYRANAYYLTESASFSQAKQSLIQAASDLYGAKSQAVLTVNDAFNAVGIQ